MSLINTNYYCNLTQIILQHKILILHNTPEHITIYLITMIFSATLNHHTTSSIMLTNQNYFLRNATMIIFCSVVKIITTHTHAQIYKETNKFFSRSICRDFGYTLHLIHPGVYLQFIARRMYLHTVTRKVWIYPRTRLFSHVWRRGRLALDPLYNKSSFRVFLSGI